MNLSKYSSKPLSWWLQTPHRVERHYRNYLAEKPHRAKQRIVRETAQRHNSCILVETGTYLGKMIEAQKSNFRHVYSIELFEPLYLAACAKFHGVGNVTLLQGDSGTVLPELVQRLGAPALFWLDGHYSGEGTGRGELGSPILSELAAIAKSPQSQSHVILIDDACSFDGHDGYPTLPDLRALCARYWPRHALHVETDIIRICPSRLNQV